MPDAIAHVTVGVADLQPVLNLWVDRFGLEIAARRRGPDHALARLWGIPAGQIADQLVLRTPGMATGWLHFVQFAEPADPVRGDAAIFDFGPKNLDVNCRDMPARVAELKNRGCRFRSAISEYEVDGVRAREVQMPSHDAVNVVLIEVLSEGFEVAMTSRGYGALTSFVIIVPDTDTEAAFYRALFDFDELMHHRLSGTAIEQAVGAPAGTVLDMRLLGRPDQFFGRVELIAYEGCAGRDRFSTARPPATGILGCGFRVDSLEETAARADAAGQAVSRLGPVDTLYAAGACGLLYSPAGLRIELYERS